VPKPIHVPRIVLESSQRYCLSWNQFLELIASTVADEKRSRYLRVLLFSWNTLCLDYLMRMSKNEGIYPSSSRLDLILNWAVQSSLISPLMTGVSSSVFCWIQPHICCTRSRSWAICFPRCPGSSSLCARAAWTRNHGQSNALVSALIETGIL
jgi:hypothetical protein